MADAQLGSATTTPTRSPSLRCVTPGPTAATFPTPS